MREYDAGFERWEAEALALGDLAVAAGWPAAVFMTAMEAPDGSASQP